jgi:hypothetical protein
MRIVAPSPAVRWVLRIAALGDAFDIEGADQPADFCACRSPRIDGVRALVATQRPPGLEESTGETG